jgi:ubiquinone/menaquinone biosynthesis C-methylase UbiE
MDEKEFYEELGMDRYLPLIRAFVPGYDEMTQKIVKLVLSNKPKKVLDIGCSIGKFF